MMEMIDRNRNGEHILWAANDVDGTKAPFAVSIANERKGVSKPNVYQILARVLRKVESTNL